MKVIIKYLLSIVFVFLLNTFNTSANESIKIGLLVPLTGEYEDIGKSIIQSTRMAINKIDDSKILILPRDTKSDPKETLKKVEELYAEGIKIFIGPVFNENLKELSKFQDVIFLSLTNKILNNPKNVMSAGINAKSQFDAIKKYQKINELKKTLVLIPKKNYKEEIEEAISKSKIKTIGIRHGEKMHETLLTKEEMSKAKDLGEYYQILPDDRDLNYDKYFSEGYNDSSNQEYNSNNTKLLNIHEMKTLLLSLPEIKEDLKN